MVLNITAFQREVPVMVDPLGSGPFQACLPYQEARQYRYGQWLLSALQLLVHSSPRARLLLNLSVLH